jgi:hypothetical protein
VQKKSLVIKGQDLQESLIKDPEFLSKITTGFWHNPENKRQSSKCKSPTSPCPKNARQVSLIVASMPTVAENHSRRSLLICFTETDYIPA